ncbi:MAG: hypothetical protein QOJ54_3079 [Aliidongia sp.]|jgi:uncharacterized membrane protein|nr:hypothetical protein [Aliidongia sp.]
MLDWTHIAPPAIAAFLASLVEFVEALTIVLAVGVVSGWRPALGGAGAGLGLLVALVAILGGTLAAAPIHLLQLALGGLSLLFGMRWLRKAILRGAGLMALHDESAVFAAESTALRAAGRAMAGMTAFKAVVVEGLEVIFIVIALGAAGQVLVPAAAGAALAFAAVVILGLALHRPLARVPENALKFAVGSMVSAFGLYWIGEGIGFGWPGGDVTILGLIAGWAGLALLMIRLLKPRAEAPQ